MVFITLFPLLQKIVSLGVLALDTLEDKLMVSKAKSQKKAADIVEPTPDPCQIGFQIPGHNEYEMEEEQEDDI